MTQEALKLALDKKADNARELGLDYEPENTLYWYALNYRTAPTQNAQAMFEALEKFVEAAIKEALARPEQEPVGYADKTTIKYLQEGLMRKAALVSKDEAMLEGEDADIPLYTTPPQRTEQEPVAWIHNFIDGGISIGKRPIDLDRHPDRWTGLYKKPKPCPTCQSLARSVMLDQTSHDTTPPQRKPLTDEEIMEKFNQATGAVWISDFARSIEAAHGIKE